MTTIGKPARIAANEGEDTLPAKVSRSARMMIGMETEDAPLIGFALVAIYADGGYSLGYQMPVDHPFLGPTLFCAMLKEIIEREMTGALAAEDYAKEYLS